MTISTHTTNLCVRDAAETDLQTLTNIKDSSALHTDRLRDAQSPTFRYLVLELTGKVIGFACLIFVRPDYWSDAQNTSRLPQIVDLQISPEFRGNGYGSYLISALELMAYESGSKEIFIAVEPLSNPRAHALYQRLGYQ